MLGLEEAQLRSFLGRGSEARRDEAGGGERAVPPAPVHALLSKRRSGQPLSAEEQAQLGAALRAVGRPEGAFSDEPARSADARGTDYQFGGDYWVVALRGGQPVPVPVRTGVTDLEYTEIVTGLGPEEQVLLLPSSSLFEQQGSAAAVHRRPLLLLALPADLRPRPLGATALARPNR